MSADSVAQDQIRAFVDRILRMREEGATRAEVRAAYAGLDGNDKVTVGLIVKTEWQARQGWRCYFAAFHTVRLLKIGISRDVTKRLRTLAKQAGEPADLLLDFPGIFFLEGWYHAAFNDHRIRGEWFALNDETRALVEQVRIAGPAVKVGA